MHKINDLSSFAGNIMHEFKNNIHTINENSKNIRNEISQLDRQSNLLLNLQSQYIQMTNLNQFLEKNITYFIFWTLRNSRSRNFKLKTNQ